MDYLGRRGQIFAVSRTRARRQTPNPTPTRGVASDVFVLPALATADQIATPLQVSSRTVLLWAEQGRIPTALRFGKTVYSEVTQTTEFTNSIFDLSTYA